MKTRNYDTLLIQRPTIYLIKYINSRYSNKLYAFMSKSEVTYSNIENKNGLIHYSLQSNGDIKLLACNTIENLYNSIEYPYNEDKRFVLSDIPWEFKVLYKKKLTPNTNTYQKFLRKYPEVLI